MGTEINREVRLSGLRDLAAPNNDWARSAPLVGAAFCLLVYYTTVFFEALVSFRYTDSLFDYGSLYASVYAWSHQLNPYLNYPLTSHPHVDSRGLFVNAVNLNPPIGLYIFQPLVAVDSTTSIYLWTLISVCLFCLSLIWVIKANPNPNLRIRVLLVLGMAGVWYTFQLGQIYMILLFLTVVVWSSFRKRRLITAGLLIGVLCALKPNFLIWPVLLILARHKKTGLTAISTFITASAIPLFFGDGIRLYSHWFAACRRFNGSELVSNSAIPVMFSRLDPYLGVSHSFRNAGYAVTIVFLLAVSWLVLRRAPGIFRTSEVALIATLLAGPISWVGYTVVLIPMLYQKRLNSLMRIGWILLCIPVWVASWIAQSSTTLFVLMASPYFYGLVLIAIAVVNELYHDKTAGQMEIMTPANTPLSEPESVIVGQET